MVGQHGCISAPHVALPLLLPLLLAPLLLPPLLLPPVTGQGAALQSKQPAVPGVVEQHQIWLAVSVFAQLLQSFARPASAPAPAVTAPAPGAAAAAATAAIRDPRRIGTAACEQGCNCEQRSDKRSFHRHLHNDSKLEPERSRRLPESAKAKGSLW